MKYLINVLFSIIICLFAIYGCNGVTTPTSPNNRWQITNDIDSASVTSIVFARTGEIFAGTSQKGIFRSIDNGNTWLKLADSQPVLFINTVAANDKDEIFCSTNSGEIYFIDRSRTAVSKIYDINIGFHSFAIDRQGNLFIGTWFHGVYKFNDNGTTWSSINFGLPDSSTIYALVIDYKYNILTGVRNSSIYKYQNNDNHWNMIFASNFTDPILSLYVDRSGHIFAGSVIGKIFLSTDGGNTWSDISIKNTDYAVSNILIKRDGIIYAGTGGDGLFISSNFGQSWSKSEQQPPSKYIRSLSLSPNDEVFIGTQNNGIFIIK